MPPTVVIAIVSSNLLSYGDGLDNPERDVTALSKQLNIVTAIMLDAVA